MLGSEIKCNPWILVVTITGRGFLVIRILDTLIILNIDTSSIRMVRINFDTIDS